jgi:hypothetical protein
MMTTTHEPEDLDPALVERLRADLAAAEPDAEDFARLRRRVLGQIAAEPARRPAPWAQWWWRGLATTAAAGLVFFAGWLVGRGPRSNGGDLERQLRRAAAGNQRFEDMENSPFAYSNVELRAAGAGRYRLALDVSRHLDVEVGAADPLLADVLVQSLLGGSSVGARLRAVSLSAPALDERVRQALIVAMRHDPNLGVRLEAQERLGGAHGDRGVEAAMLDVLAQEESVQMRLSAIEYLASGRTAPELVARALETASAPSNAFVLAKAGDYLGTKRVLTQGDMR